MAEMICIILGTLFGGICATTAIITLFNSAKINFQKKNCENVCFVCVIFIIQDDIENAITSSNSIVIALGNIIKLG